MKNKFLGVLAIIAILAPGISFAQVETAALQAEVATLAGQVVSLESQLSAGQVLGASTTAAVSGMPIAVGCYNFSANLGMGSSGPAVSALQTALLKDGETVSVTGYFGKQTFVAVEMFQEKYASQILTTNGLTSGNGYVGASTRAMLNLIYGCKGVSTSTLKCPDNAMCVSPTPLMVTSLAPSTGMVGVQVTITGSGFTTVGNSVSFGSKTLASPDTIMNLSSANGTSLTFTVPAHWTPSCSYGPTPCPFAFIPTATGVYQVSVTNAKGTSNAVNFTVTSATPIPTPVPPIPAPTSTTANYLSPASGAVGTLVTVHGSGFGASNLVEMNGLVTNNLENVPSTDGKTLQFTVPSSIGPLCAAGMACPQFILLVTPGNFQISVVTGSSTRNIGTFTVVGNPLILN